MPTSRLIRLATVLSAVWAAALTTLVVAPAQAADGTAHEGRTPWP